VLNCVLNKGQDNGYCPELIIILIYHCHKLIDLTLLLDSLQYLTLFHEDNNFYTYTNVPLGTSRRY
jgi:hypothetical protein